jgi:hypothetical protein
MRMKICTAVLIGLLFAGEAVVVADQQPFKLTLHSSGRGVTDRYTKAAILREDSAASSRAMARVG